LSENESESIRLVSDKEPSEKEILAFVGKAGDAWIDFTSFLDKNYDFVPEKRDYGKNWGWVIRYRKSNRTWIALYPEKNCFVVQIIFGKKEVEKFQSSRADFSDFVLSKFDNTKQLHDGRWMFFNVKDFTLIDDLKKLMKIKRKPKVK
jgi:hypothetical protein